MADVYEKDLAQKSSLTTSDFIRVVGSDNVSYKQGMASVAKTIGEVTTAPFGSYVGTALTASDDLNNLTVTGRYIITGSSIPSEANHYPTTGTSSGGFIDVISRGNDQVWQYYHTFNNRIFHRLRFSVSAGGTWTVWQQIPMQTEVDTLSAFALAYRRTLTSADDCNTLTQGVYVFNTSIPQNAPSGVSYGTLIVVSGTYGASIYNFQLLSTAGRGLYYRRKLGQPSDGFSAWTKVTGTQV